MFSAQLQKRSRFILTAVAASSATYLANNNMTFADSKPKSKKVVVIGGGSGGIGVSAMLGNEGFENVSVIEPKDVHYYQPIWSLVGANAAPNSKSVRPMKEIFPASAKWIKNSAFHIDPENNMITLDDGSKVEYDLLVVSAGIESLWDGIPGLKDALDDENSGVVSIYDYNYVQKCWKNIEGFTQGRAIFMMPSTPVKCPGAPQKIMWLFEERMRDLKIRDRVSVEWWVPGGAMFGVKKYSDMLTELQKERGVIPQFKQVLTSIDGKNKKATFKNADTGAVTVEEYDLLHAVPPMGPPAVISTSSLAAPGGFMDVDKYTLQSTKYPNVFGLGDCTNTPNSKTAAAITKQAPILVHNLTQVAEGKEPNAKYNGYASCPLIVSKNRVILAEFGYGGKIMETFSSDTGKFPYSMFGQEGSLQQRAFFALKDTIFPYVYWNLWTKGKWFGTSGPFKPNVLEEDK